MSNPGQAKRTCILVLGMHRSGTSALTGALTRVGIDGPATPMDSDSTNSKGFFESKEIWRFHENLLSSAGSSWDDWRTIDPAWASSSQGEKFSKQALKIIDEEFKGSTFFVLKDPRVCRLMPFWINVLKLAEVSPVALHIHRHPVEVAESLQNRDGFDYEYSYLLWLRHILDAELGSRQLPRIFTSFSRFLEDWPQVLNQAQDAFGILWPNYSAPVFEEINEFLSLGMKHYNNNIKIENNDQKLSNWLRNSLLIMERWIQGKGEQGDQDKLDEIRHELDAAAQVFGTALYGSNRAVRKLKKHNEALAAEKGKIEKIAANKADCKLLEERIESLEKDNIKALAENLELEAAVTKLKKQNEILKQENYRHLEVIEGQNNNISVSQSAFERKLYEINSELELIRKEQAAERLVQGMEIERVRKLELDLAKEILKNKKLAGENLAELAVYKSEAKRHAEIEGKIALLQHALVEEKGARQAIYSSNSWRVTAPLRWVSSRLKRHS